MNVIAVTVAVAEILGCCLDTFSSHLFRSKLLSNLLMVSAFFHPLLHVLNLFYLLQVLPLQTLLLIEQFWLLPPLLQFARLSFYKHKFVITSQTKRDFLVSDPP
jgi:hypothetical protein